MERLNSLREQYMHHMSSRLKSKSMDEDTLLQARTQKEFQFLERNLEELDRAHKKARILPLKAWVVLASQDILNDSLQQDIFCYRAFSKIVNFHPLFVPLYAGHFREG